MPIDLLTTKLYIPPARPNAVARPRLIEKLLTVRNLPGSFVLLSGPAGFGKTTLLSEFASQLPGSVAWVSLDESDNDPARFWSYLIAACQTVQPGVGEAALAVFQSSQPQPPETIPTLLINDLAAQAGDLLLVLDDYHAIQNPAIHTAVAYLLEHLPARLRVILSTRIDPPIPLARFRARNQLVEVRSVELRFTLAEAVAFLDQVMGLRLSLEDVAALAERTEGWAAGLQLAALSLQGQGDVTGFIKAFTGSHVYVAEYLLEEVLQRQPEDVQRFLMQTALLERFSASLCEAVTGQPEAQSVLAALTRANLFVVPLDREGQWFRYHRLFADLLTARLQQKFPAEAVAELNRRASRWYDQHGFATEAVDHSLAAKDFEQAARWIEQNSYSLVTRGELATLIKWIDALPTEVRQHRPRFLLAKAWALLFGGAAEQIQQLLAQMEAQGALEQGTAAAGELLGSAAAMRAFFALMSGDHARALELAERAESLLPPLNESTDQSSPYLLAAHSILPYTLGMAYRGQGQYEKAAEAFSQELEMFAKPQDILAWTITTIEVAVVRRLQGRLQESEAICHRALQRIVDQKLYSLGSLARVEATLSEALCEEYRLYEAHQRVTGAIQRMQTWNMPTDHLSACLTLGHVQLAQGDLAGAADTIRTAKELRLTQSVFADLSRALDLLEIRAALAAHDLTSAASLMDALQPGTSPLVYLRDQELVLLARLRLAQGKPAEAVAILSPLAHSAHTGGRNYTWLTAEVQHVLALDALGEREAARAVLLQALEFAAAEGFVTVFVDEGAGMRSLILGCRAEIITRAAQPLQKFTDSLLKSFPPPAQPAALPPATARSAPSAELIEPLSPRELEVLQLIALGDSNRAIAEKLVITVSAVKKHTGNIFGKLSVNSRTQAVARARQLGILAS